MTSRVGQVRPSQLLYTYGPGSLVDLPHVSVLVSGIDDWADEPPAAPEVQERRLLAAVRGALGPQVRSLRFPPHLPDTGNPFDDWARTGVPVATFPRWIRCPLCNRIAPFDSGLFDLHEQPYRPDQVRYTHNVCAVAKGKPPPAVPVRFLLACRNGHLDEFPWVQFVHRAPKCPSGAALLEMFERQQSMRTDDLLVKCTTCDTTRSMVDAFGEAAARNLPKCRGRHPHLRRYDDEPCPQRTRTLLLGASNTWFSSQLRVLAIPIDALPLRQLVDELWPRLSGMDDVNVLKWALTNVPELARLAPHDPAEIWTEIQRHRAGDVDEVFDEDLLAPEWAQFVDPAKAPKGRDFLLRQVAVPTKWDWLIERVVLVERLREVVALVGFTRIDPPGEPDDAGRLPALAPLARGKPGWVPCTDVRGEGIFVQFKETAVAAWEKRVETSRRLQALVEAHARWRSYRKLDPATGWPGARFVALHSASHLLMREFALECGYGSASLTERIYARSEGEPMAGVLLYTAAPDSEGTLGGLVGLGETKSLGRLLDNALSHAGLCSSDPMCSEHTPSEDEDVLHGAACHACLFAPETACERANRYLDRSFAVDTFAEQGLALFKK